MCILGKIQLFGQAAGLGGEGFEFKREGDSIIQVKHLGGVEISIKQFIHGIIQ